MKAETEFDHKGYRIRICQDSSPQSPECWGDDQQFLVYDHRDFYVHRAGFSPQEVYVAWKQGRKFKGYHAFPVYAYIHSGVSLSLGKSEYPFTDPWDVSFKGFALIRQAKGQKMAEGLIESWNAYLSGNVYGYQVVDAMGEEMDSCWGFYGNEQGFGSSGVVEEAMALIDAYLDNPETGADQGRKKLTL